MTGTIDAEALAIAIGEARCREFGVRQIRTFADTDDGIPGTVIAVSVSRNSGPWLLGPYRKGTQTLLSAQARSLPRRDARRHGRAGDRRAGCLGRGTSSRLQRRHHRPPGEDLLEAVAERAAAGEAYGETPMFPAGALETIAAGGQAPAGCGEAARRRMADQLALATTRCSTQKRTATGSTSSWFPSWQWAKRSRQTNCGQPRS